MARISRTSGTNNVGIEAKHNMYIYNYIYLYIYIDIDIDDGVDDDEERGVQVMFTILIKQL